MRRLLIVFFIITFSLFAGCASSSSYVTEPESLERGRLPTPDVAVKVQHLRPCTDSADQTLRFNSNYPVTVLVHGCKGSAGRFRSLAQLYAFHGQQAVCFSYDDRDSLVKSSGQLISAINELASHNHDRKMSIIGHSMGGLVARKAMEAERHKEWQRDSIDIELVTVSAPLAGIKSASTCGKKPLHWLSLGVVPGICWAITGDNWNEITSKSDFIRYPGPLLPFVQKYLKVVTDERDTCRRKDINGACLESDFVFTLTEQYHPVVDNYSQVSNVEVNAGHVEIVGFKQAPPHKLLEILQQQGMLSATPPERRAALNRLLDELY